MGLDALFKVTIVHHDDYHLEEHFFANINSMLMFLSSRFDDDLLFGVVCDYIVERCDNESQE